VPKVFGNGWMIVGDSGGFVNAVHREGSNLAMTTGRLAAETAIAAKAAGKGFEAKLWPATRRLDESFVMKDLHKYRDMPTCSTTTASSSPPTPSWSTAPPDHVHRGWHRQETKEKEIFSSFRKSRSLAGLAGDAFKLWRAFR
jgi:electron transfer flavoprotein-quinone oxidoreductase